MLQQILQILFPSPCVSCGLLSEALCSRCINRLVFEPHKRKIEDLLICSAMIYRPHSLLEELIKPFKYKHQANLFRLFVPPMCEALRLLSDSPQKMIFVPVPLHPKRKLERGYNQAELLAKWVAKRLGAEWLPLLKRVKDTGHQARISDKQSRAANMVDAFQLLRAPPEHGQIVLVDDIVTSGATLLACRDILKAAGVTQLSALTLADREKQRTDSRH